MKKIFATVLLLASICCFQTAAMAGTHGTNGTVTGKSVAAGLVSLIVWPGIGQAINDGNNDDKAITHAVLGLTGVFRFWSCYDGIANRKGGVWKSRI